MHITQVSPFGVMRVMHFEAMCRSLRTEPTFERFNVFYRLESKESGWFSFTDRKRDISVTVTKSSPKSLRDWKRCFFFVKAGVLPVQMSWLHLRAGEKTPSFEVLRNFEDEDWFQTLITHQSRIDDFEHSGEEMLALLIVSRLGLQEGKDVLPDGGGIELLAGMK